MTHKFTQEERLKGAMNIAAKVKERAKWRLENLPFDELSAREKRRRVLLEQGNKCAICNRDPVWNNKPLKFQWDHINGTKIETRDNVRYICPNCHSQTPTFSRCKTEEGRLRQIAGAAKGSIGKNKSNRKNFFRRCGETVDTPT